jgi:hypothetical protein
MHEWMKFTPKWITILAFWVSVNFLPKRGGAGRFGSLLTSTSAPPLHNKNMKIVRLLCHCSCKVTDKQNRCHSILFIHNNSLDCILNLLGDIELVTLVNHNVTSGFFFSLFHKDRDIVIGQCHQFYVTQVLSELILVLPSIFYILFLIMYPISPLYIQGSVARGKWHKENIL